MRVFPLFLLVGCLLAVATTPVLAASTQSPIDFTIPVGRKPKLPEITFNYPADKLGVELKVVKVETPVNNDATYPLNPLLPFQPNPFVLVPPFNPGRPTHDRHKLTDPTHPLHDPGCCFNYPFQTPPETGLQLELKPKVAMPTLKIVEGDWKGTYKLKELHFHQRSEHEINGRHFPMELHLVHEGINDGTNDVTGKNLAIGRWIGVGGNSQLLDGLFGELLNMNHPVETSKIELCGLVDPRACGMNMGASHDSYRYDGSLTTGPVISPVEVRWIVFNEPLKMSMDLIQGFRSHLARGTVRKVWTPGDLIDARLQSHFPVYTDVPEPGTVWLLIIAGLMTPRYRRR